MSKCNTVLSNQAQMWAVLEREGGKVRGFVSVLNWRFFECFLLLYFFERFFYFDYVPHANWAIVGQLCFPLSPLLLFMVCIWGKRTNSTLGLFMVRVLNQKRFQFGYLKFWIGRMANCVRTDNYRIPDNFDLGFWLPANPTLVNLFFAK